MSATDLQPSNKTSHLRRSQRVCLRLPIVVLREGPGDNVASEETHTLIVNAHGALIQLALTDEIGQLLGIKNVQTMEELVCRVVNLGPDQPGKREVGVEFELPSPRFWRMLSRRPIGPLEAQMQKLRRRVRTTVKHLRRKPAACQTKLTKSS